MSKSPWRSRIITLKGRDESLTSQVRVNIFYERDMLDSESGASTSSTPPPKLEVEAYEDIAPMWSGQEEIIPDGISSDGRLISPPRHRDTLNKAISNNQSSSMILNQCTQRKRKVGISNVLRFASIDEMSSYCNQNNINLSNRYVMPTKLPHMSQSTDGSQWTEHHNNPDRNFVISIDEGYATKSLEFAAQQNQNAGCVLPENNGYINSMTVCRICNIAVISQKKKQHIYVAHLRQPLYKCPLCEFCNLYHKANVEIHIKRRHGVSLKPISLKEEYAKDIDTWLYLCFADRRLLRCIDPDVINTVCDLVEWTQEGRTVPIVTAIPPNDMNLMSPSLLQQNNDNNFDPQQMPEDLLEPDATEFHETPKHEENNGRPRTHNTCNICKMVNVRHMERHVLQHHVRLPMFLCPFCPYSSNYAVNSVKDHIRVKHSLTEHAQPIDLRDENWLHIRKIYDRCFVSQILQTHNMKKDKNRYKIPFVGK